MCLLKTFVTTLVICNWRRTRHRVHNKSYACYVVCAVYRVLCAMRYVLCAWQWAAAQGSGCVPAQTQDDLATLPVATCHLGIWKPLVTVDRRLNPSCAILGISDPNCAKLGVQVAFAFAFILSATMKATLALLTNVITLVATVTTADECHNVCADVKKVVSFKSGCSPFRNSLPRPKVRARRSL